MTTKANKSDITLIQPVQEWESKDIRGSPTAKQSAKRASGVVRPKMSVREVVELY